MEIISDRNEKQCVVTWTNRGQISLLTLHLNDLKTEFFDLDEHLFPDKVEAHYLKRVISQKNGLFTIVKDSRYGD
jgi:hypothetical protein